MASRVLVIGAARGKNSTKNTLQRHYNGKWEGNKLETLIGTCL
jgi:hypothetical protein